MHTDFDDPADLIDPDGEREARYEWDDNYQACILGMLLGDRAFLLHSLNLIRPSYFANKAHRAIAEEVFKFFTEHRTVPQKAYVQRLLRDRFKDDEGKVYFLGALQEVYDSFEPGLESRDFLQKDIANFARKQALQEAFKKSLAEMKGRQDDDAVWDRIDHILRAALTINPDFDEGLDYFGSLRDRYARKGEQQKNREVFKTGFKGIDDALNKGGLCRGEIGSVMGLSGVGKSLFLVRMAVENIFRGKKVLYVSLEMTEDDIASRFDAQIAKTNIRNLYQNRDHVIEAIEQSVEEFADKKLFIVKQFAAGTADVNTVRAYHQQLQMAGFVPDLVIVDYIGEMKDYAGFSIHESRKKLTTELRGFAMEANVCVMTAMQTNRGGKESQKDGGVTGKGDLAASFDQAQPLDALWSVNQTDAEKQMFVGRIGVDKHRDGKSNFKIYVGFDQDTLEIFEIPESKYRNALNSYKEKAADELKLDEKYEATKNKRKPRMETPEEPD